MKRQLPFEFVFQIASLVIALIVVHLLYLTVVRPNADAFLEAQAARVAAGEELVQEQNLYVILKDYEQESCFILGLWALAIMGYKMRVTLRQRALLDDDIVKVTEGMSILPEDTREYVRPIQGLPHEVQGYLLPRALSSALQRFAATRNVTDVSEAVKSVCAAESDRFDTELAMVRYIAWAIPSIGFIGTVRGISAALAQVQQAVEGNILGVTESLGTAFNSTLIALLISIVIMLITHQLQLLHERLVLDTHTYCDERLVRHLQVRGA